jgi:SRSO17 transposase
MQHLLARAVWDHDGVRDDVRGYLVDQLGEPDAVLVVDETGDLKKGTTTVGIQRQYTGTAGRIENAQVAVYLVYAARAGHAIIDRELYVPRSWTGDRDRRQDAGIPEQVEFATKPALATGMIRRALDAGVPAGWVAGDEVYGADPALRAELEAKRSAMCWRWPATIVSTSTPAAPATALTPWSARSRRGPGSRCRAARAPRATGSTTGRSSAFTTMTTTATRPGGIGC